MNHATTDRSVNDIHGKLYPTTVDRVLHPKTIGDVQAAIELAAREGLAISIAGGRHAMGGQQFGQGTILLDMSQMNRVLALDQSTGVVTAEAGIQWPELMTGIADAQLPEEPVWGIRQKQTGADRLSLGGALSANVHGRGLAMKPIVDDIVSFELVDASGELRNCSRTEHPDLFRLGIGGYGLFGVIVTVRLRLAKRQKVERIVEMRNVEEVMDAFDQRIADGFQYGDFQFAIDPAGDDFMRSGVFSCYRPVSNDAPIPDNQRVLSLQDWGRLLYLGHVDKRQAVDMYAAHYLATSGQIYWSDSHQLSEYIDDYHLQLDQAMAAPHPCTEVITEIYVPRESLANFFSAVRDDFRANNVNVIYGTVRLIEADTESFLAWARQPWACTIFNLHTEHTSSGIAQAAASFRRLIDLAISFGGSYYLTYHRFATREQIESCYPKFREFLSMKRQFDPAERFQSDWYRHYRTMFADLAPGTGELESAAN